MTIVRRLEQESSMRSTTSRKALATVFVLGLIWFVAMVGGVSVLMHPMLALYEALGVESAAVQLLATMLLVIIQASLVTVGVGLVLRIRSEPAPATQRR
jgi:hypothetical protein